MIRGRHARSSAQDHLSGHKLSVKFAQGARKRLVTWMARASTGRPFLAVSKKLVNALSCRRCWMQPPRIQQKRAA